jgi:phosphopantothenoylcysteine decarboxylase/phosphopantothenate--cysteine ligase
MRILITAGPTREYIDTVRFISNASSGRMGFAIGAAAAARGHSVILVSGPTELPNPPGVDVRRVVSAEEMFHAALEVFSGCDAAIMAAAVSDYRPRSRANTKTPKGQQSLTLELEPTPDICAHLGPIKSRRFVIAFAMEDRLNRASAEWKLEQKQADAIVLNTLVNLGSDQATVEIFVKSSGWRPPITGTKNDVAKAIVTLGEQLVAQRPISTGAETESADRVTAPAEQRPLTPDAGSPPNSGEKWDSRPGRGEGMTGSA